MKRLEIVDDRTFDAENWLLPDYLDSRVVRHLGWRILGRDEEKALLISLADGRVTSGEVNAI